MNKPFQFLAIFRTYHIQDTNFKITIPSTTIEILKEARTYRVPKQIAHRFPDNTDKTVMRIDTLNINAEFTHIAIVSQTRKTDANKAKEICEDLTDTAIAILSAIFQPEIFDHLIYRGWLISDDGWGIMEAYIDPSQKINKLPRSPVDVIREIRKARKNLISNKEMQKRFIVMSRFWAKALAFHPCEEKFILLWTILEIFPMKNTSNIKPLVECCAIILDKPQAYTKERLRLGKLYGYRCDLVHNGTFPTGIEQISEIFDKLEKIIFEIFRYMIGLPYSGSLDKYCMHDFIEGE